MPPIPRGDQAVVRTDGVQLAPGPLTTVHTYTPTAAVALARPAMGVTELRERCEASVGEARVVGCPLVAAQLW